MSFAVVAAPILYPRYFLFTRRAEQGVERLQKIRTQEGNVEVAYIGREEKGFKEISEVAELVFGFDKKAKRISLAIGHPRDLGEFTGLGMEYGIGDNGVLYAERLQGGPELLRWEPWSPTTALELEKLHRGIRLRTRERSHLLTVGLAVLWTTLSIVLAIQ